MLNLARDRTIYISRIFLLSLFVPFICTFLGHLQTNQKSVQDRVGLMYQTLSVPPYVSILNAVALCKLALLDLHCLRAYLKFSSIWWDGAEDPTINILFKIDYQF